MTNGIKVGGRTTRKCNNIYSKYMFKSKDCFYATPIDLWTDKDWIQKILAINNRFRFIEFERVHIRMIIE